MSTLKRYPQRLRRGDRLSGFTLLETLIAGVLVIMTMTAVSRMGTSALAGSSNYAERRKIEADIETHIQLIQQADSLLTYERIPSAHQSSACLTPAKYLAKVLRKRSDRSWRELANDNSNPESSTRYFQTLTNHLMRTSNQSHSRRSTTKILLKSSISLSPPKTILPRNIVDSN